MFGIGTTELLVILVIALVVLGPKKLPEVAKGLGRALGELRRASQDLRDTIDLEARDSSTLARRPPPSGVEPVSMTPEVPTVTPADGADPASTSPRPSDEPNDGVDSEVDSSS